MASTEDDLFALIAATDVRAVRGLLEDAAVARDGPRRGRRLRPDARALPDGPRARGRRARARRPTLDVFEAAAFGDLDRLSELFGDRSRAGRRHERRRIHAAAPGRVLRQTDAVRLLLARGAEPDARGQGWMTGTPLSAAAAGGHTAIVLLLLEVGVDPNVQQAQGFTPLHAAAQNADLEAVRALLDAGADPAIVTEDGVTAVELAEQAGDLVTVETLRDALG